MACSQPNRARRAPGTGPGWKAAGDYHLHMLMDSSRSPSHSLALGTNLSLKSSRRLESGVKRGVFLAVPGPCWACWSEKRGGYFEPGLIVNRGPACPAGQRAEEARGNTIPSGVSCLNRTIMGADCAGRPPVAGIPGRTSTLECRLRSSTCPCFRRCTAGPIQDGDARRRSGAARSRIGSISGPFLGT